MATPIYYIDISKTGKDYVGKRDISLLTNEQAVLESVKNILLTEPNEWVMRPSFGCPLSPYLFEFIDSVTIVSIRSSITNAIRGYEKRIDKLEVIVTENIDQNSIDITIKFNMKTSEQIQTLSLQLNKIR